MSTLRARLLAVIALWATPSGIARAEISATAPRLGTPVTAEQAAKWDLTIFPDGRGLPPGHGSAVEGRVLFDRHCASCHGAGGRGATAEELVGEPVPPTAENPGKAIGPYWPFATTIFDYNRRSMPPAAPGSLSADEHYAIVAYLLFANKIIGEKDEINASTLPKIKMPNRDGFIWIDVAK